jgi:creatinine amidohydrolase/Fe(II)-dependent formamide hydrolase-like protein
MVPALAVSALALPGCEGSSTRAPAASAPSAAAPATSAKPSSIFLADFTSQELGAAIAAGDTIALVYTGSTEGSGPHLALGKHNVRAPYYAERIARELGHTLVGLIVPFGVSPEELARYPGTIALREATQVMLQEDVVRSLARAGFTRIVLLTEHGPNLPALQRAAAVLDVDLAPRGTRVLLSTANYTQSTAEIGVWGRTHGLYAGGHGGLWDTSELWFVDSTRVRPGLIALGDTAAAHSDPKQQVTGDPRQASAALGRIFADIRVRNGVAEIRRLLSNLDRSSR